MSDKKKGEAMTRTFKILSVVALTVAGMIGSSQVVVAQSRCERRIHQAEENLRVAIERHGEHSRQAEKRRHELDEVHRSCDRQ
jgi:hypothetical protein